MIAVPKPSRQVDEAFRGWIRMRPCHLKGRRGHLCTGPVDAAHVHSRGAGGGDRRNLIPMCRAAHAEQHARGVKSFGLLYGNLEQEARRYWEQYTGTELSVVRSTQEAKQAARKQEAMTRRKLFHALLTQAGLPLPTPEVEFHPTRKWRLDYSWPEHKVAIEIEGGIFMPGGSAHSRGVGIRRDMEKGNAAVLLGWLVLRVFPEKLATNETVVMLKQLLGGTV